MNLASKRMALSIDEAGEIRTGKLQAKKVGRRTLIMADELRRYLDALPSLQLGE